MKYAYPVIFTPVEEGGYDVKVPDLPGCRTCGDSLADALCMAADAAALWLWDAEEKKEPIPPPTQPEQVEAPAFINYIYADTGEYRRKYGSYAVKKTLSIPAWLNDKAMQAGVNFSQVLQDALKEKLHVDGPPTLEIARP